MDKSEACLSVVTPTVGNLILSGREKGSGKYKKKIGQAVVSHFIYFSFISPLELFNVLILGIVGESHYAKLPVWTLTRPLSPVILIFL